MFVFNISLRLHSALSNCPQLLKASQPEKKQPVTPKHQNGVLKKTKKNLSKNISENNAAPSQTDTEKKVKHRSAPNSVVPKEAGVNSKAPAASDTQQRAAPKRKKDSGKSNGEQAAKKKKSVVEERKPTEYVYSAYFY